MKSKEHKIPKQYLAGLSRGQSREAVKSAKRLQKHIVKAFIFLHLSFSFESKKSRHVVDFERRYNIKK